MPQARFHSRILARTAFFLTPPEVTAIPRALAAMMAHLGPCALVLSRMITASMQSATSKIPNPAAKSLAAPELVQCAVNGAASADRLSAPRRWSASFCPGASAQAGVRWANGRYPAVPGRGA
jgi:hypothetical protein